ncbi:MAG: NAD(+)/NADH kinase [Archaeoglobus sp.]|jgi:NAD+ kinase|nr:MAG: NAD(+)/NADH kinase [Archaeoglobus sp.]
MKGIIVYKPGSEKIANKAFTFLESIGIPVDIADKCSKCEKYDFIVTVGGDGTILRTLQQIRDCPPIFGINTGKVGLLTHATPENFKDKLSIALEKMEIEEFMRIECENLIALNEIALLTAMPARLVEFSVFVDGVEIDRLRSDGLLISTPIGSTAYALSTGGPIIDPKMECTLIVPVAPFKLGWKPWIVGKQRKVEVEVVGRHCLAIADGHTTLQIEPKTTLLFRKSKYPARFFKVENRIARIINMLRNI